MKKQKLIEHFQEFKYRLSIVVICFVFFSLIAYIFAEQIFNLLLVPLDKISLNTDRKIIFTNLSEMFVTELRLSIMAGFIITWPIAMLQLYNFISPALYKKEKKIILPMMIAVVLLFIIGCLFSYFIILPIAWKFFISFEIVKNYNNLPIILEAKASEYFSLVINILTAGGVIFQLPIFMICSMLMGLVSVEWYMEKRKYALIIIFIVAAILTPPDVFSQIILAIPMLLLYELSIIVGKILR